MMRHLAAAGLALQLSKQDLSSMMIVHGLKKEGVVNSFSYHVHSRGPVHALQIRLQG